MALACSATCNHCLWRMLESSIQNVVHMLPMFHPYSGSSPRKMTKKGTPNSHGVSMCIDCFSVFPYQTGAKIAINCMGKNVHVFPHILRRGSPQICKSSHKWVPQLPLRGRSRTGSAAVGLGPAGWGWTRLPARKVAGPPMG